MQQSVEVRAAADRGRVELAPGAVWLKAYLDADLQQSLARAALALLEGPVSAYVPTVRGGGRMRVRMLCLGRHWNAMTYRYEATRADHDGAAVPPVPPAWAALAHDAAAEAGFPDFTPDLCIVNWYGGDGRMGLHQDKDESADSLAAGLPVVSISLGDSARFLIGGLRRREPVQALWLESGDAFVFGGPSRLRYHGVTRIAPAVPRAIEVSGRINLTFRRF